MRATWTFHSAGSLVFGRGAVDQVADHVARMRAAQVLIITDACLQQAGALERVTKPLQKAGVHPHVFLGGQREPSLEVALAAFDFAQKVNPPVVIGLGGGSNLDVAKEVALLLAHGGQPADYFGYDNVPGPVRPIICIPTTAGTGSEVSHSAVLTDTANAVKVSTLSNWLRPAVAIVDPELTLTCPKQVAADSGIDALTHAIEAYTAIDSRQLILPPGEKYAYQGAYPLGESLAEQAIRLIGKFLPQAVNRPESIAAREGMALAATLAGMAFSNCGVALVHALEYPLGAALHCSHGAGNGLLLPHVMRFNRPERIPALARIAAFLGVDTGSHNDEAASLLAIERIEALTAEIGIPRRLRDLGAQAEQLPLFAAKAFAIKRLLRINPRDASEADLLGILQTAF